MNDILFKIGFAMIMIPMIIIGIGIEVCLFVGAFMFLGEPSTYPVSFILGFLFFFFNGAILIELSSPRYKPPQVPSPPPPPPSIKELTQ